MANYYDNSVSISGKVVNVYDIAEKKCCILTIKTDQWTFPKVICFQKNYEKAKSISVGEFVSALGNLQSGKHDSRITCSIFCNQLLEGSSYEYYNHFHLNGILQKVLVNGKKLVLIIATFVNGHFSTIPVCCFTNTPENFSVWSAIDIFGHIRCRKVETAEGTSYYQDYIADSYSEGEH